MGWIRYAAIGAGAFALGFFMRGCFGVAEEVPEPEKLRYQINNVKMERVINGSRKTVGGRATLTVTNEKTRKPETYIVESSDYKHVEDFADTAKKNGKALKNPYEIPRAGTYDPDIFTFPEEVTLPKP